MLLIAALPLFLEAEPRIGIPSQRLLTRQSLVACFFTGVRAASGREESLSLRKSDNFILRNI